MGETRECENLHEFIRLLVNNDVTDWTIGAYRGMNHGSYGISYTANVKGKTFTFNYNCSEDCNMSAFPDERHLEVAEDSQKIIENVLIEAKEFCLEKSPTYMKLDTIPHSCDK